MIKSVVVETEEGRKVEVVGENAFLRSCLEVMLEDYPDSFKEAEKPDYGAEYAEIKRSRDAAMENQRTLSKANRMLMNENEGLKKRIEELEGFKEQALHELEALREENVRLISENGVCGK